MIPQERERQHAATHSNSAISDPWRLFVDSESRRVIAFAAPPTLMRRPVAGRLALSVGRLHAQCAPRAPGV